MWFHKIGVQGRRDFVELGNLALVDVIHQIHPNDGLSCRHWQFLQVPLLVRLGGTCIQLLSGTDL